MPHFDCPALRPLPLMPAADTPDTPAGIPAPPSADSLYLDPLLVQPLLGPWACRFDIEALASCTSTNDVASQRAQFANAPSGTVVVADRQEAGRGRRGRQWISHPEDSLTFSLVWRFARQGSEPAPLSGLSLAVGVALARALETLGVTDLRLKWPNDLLRIPPDCKSAPDAQDARAGKLGGILIELQTDRRGTVAIIGIGLNLRAPTLAPQETPAAGLFSDLPPDADDPLRPQPDRHRVLAALLQALAPALDTFTAHGFAAFQHDWAARQAWPQQPVVVIDQGHVTHQGRCRGVTPEGALLLDCDGTLIPVIAGDVSLRQATEQAPAADRP